jgi:hypothetical protein
LVTAPAIGAFASVSFCALEAHVNSLGEEFSLAAGLPAHEQGILLERDVRLEEGRFQLKDNLRIARLEDRIEFLHTKFSGSPVNHKSEWWQQLSSAIDLRNKLTHAKVALPLSPAAVKNAVLAVINTLDALYRAIYRRPFPLSSLSMKSQLNF